MPNMSRLLVAALVRCAVAAPLPPIVFSAGFTSSAVLQSGASASVYGFVTPLSGEALPAVEATLTRDGAPPVVVAAALVSAGAGSTCDAACWAAGHLSSAGDISPCQIPSCSMGCSLAASPAATAASCAASCLAKGCSFDIARRLGNWSQDMCEGGLAGGGCPGSGECEAGCAFAFATPAPLAWKATFPPQATGGNATVAVACTAGCATAEPTVLSSVTFGSVYFCFGQSNMALFSNNTYDFPAFKASVLGGAYPNLRLFQYGNMGYKTESDSPAFASTALAYPAWPWLSARDAIGYKAGGGSRDLSQFPATCLYFAQSLIDLLGANAPPIGLIATAVGGTSIESWSDADSYAACSSTQQGNSAAPPVSLFNGLTAPFVNTSISGWVIYQGENNCGGVPGNSATGVGYGCLMPRLVSSYRRWFSAVPNTTDPLAPFGVVTLAATTSEGNGVKMAAMRWSQTANFGVLPNAAMPNTFLAQAFDLGDPWEMASADAKHCSKPPRAADCAPWSTAGFDASLLPLAPAIEADVAPSFMGGIHPRIKSPVGRRLAHALFHSQLGGTVAFTGPTISGCSLAGGEITLRFNATLLRGEPVSVGAWDADQTRWGTADSSGPMVCFPSLGAGDCLTSPSLWRAAAVRVGADAASAVLTLPAGLGAPAAVRYGWPLSDAGDTCCPGKNATAGLAACTPGACPIKTAVSLLPANPIYANVTAGGTCACLLPQVCDA
jgi:hypothetical protein